MSENVTQKARALADAIKLSPEFILMRAAEDAANQEEDLLALYRLYEEKREAVEQLTMEDDPDYDRMMDMTHELEELKAQYNAHPLAKAVTRSRRDFSAMMKEVNMILQSALNPEGTVARGCSGSCAGCSGCD